MVQFQRRCQVRASSGTFFAKGGKMGSSWLCWLLGGGLQPWARCLMTMSCALR